MRWDTEAIATQRFPARIALPIHQRAGSLAQISQVIAEHDGNIDNIAMKRRTPDFTDILIDLSVWDLKHLNGITAELRAKAHHRPCRSCDGMTRAGLVHQVALTPHDHPLRCGTRQTFLPMRSRRPAMTPRPHDDRRPRAIAFDIIETVFSLESLRTGPHAAGLADKRPGNMVRRKPARRLSPLPPPEWFAPFRAVMADALADLLQRHGGFRSWKTASAAFLDGMKTLNAQPDAAEALSTFANCGHARS